MEKRRKDGGRYAKEEEEKKEYLSRKLYCATFGKIERKREREKEKTV